MAKNSEGFMSVQEAAAVLGVPDSVVHRMIRHGLLDRYRLRERYVRVKTGDVLAFLDVPREWLARC